jgi:hypothetical protein
VKTYLGFGGMVENKEDGPGGNILILTNKWKFRAKNFPKLYHNMIKRQKGAEGKGLLSVDQNKTLLCTPRQMVDTF